MTPCLLDVNVLIALIDPAHIQHDRAHDWFAATGHRAWATCPITENGVIRIVGHPQYPNSPGTPGAVAELLKLFCSASGHRFWPDNISLVQNQHVKLDRLLDSGQVTDTYLLALAQAHQGKLATFDRQLVTNAVANGAKALVLIS
jgi:toxin-antitoxin system PIN domain toxin